MFYSLTLILLKGYRCGNTTTTADQLFHNVTYKMTSFRSNSQLPTLVLKVVHFCERWKIAVLILTITLKSSTLKLKYFNITRCMIIQGQNVHFMKLGV